MICVAQPLSKPACCQSRRELRAVWLELAAAKLRLRPDECASRRVSYLRLLDWSPLF